MNVMQVQNEELERIWSRLLKSSGSSEDLRDAVLEAITVMIGLTAHVGELEVTVKRLEAELEQRK